MHEPDFVSAWPDNEPGWVLRVDDGRSGPCWWTGRDHSTTTTIRWALVWPTRRAVEQAWRHHGGKINRWHTPQPLAEATTEADDRQHTAVGHDRDILDALAHRVQNGGPDLTFTLDPHDPADPADLATTLTRLHRRGWLDHLEVHTVGGGRRIIRARVSDEGRNRLR